MRRHQLLLVTWLSDVKDNVEKLLQDNKYPFDSVTTPIEAIDAIGKYSYKVIILDSLLPGLNGYLLVKRLKQTSHGQYARFIVFMNNIPSDKIAEVKKKWGIHTLLKKPIDSDELLNSLKEAEAYDLPSEKLEVYTTDCIEELFADLAFTLWTGKLTCYGDNDIIKEIYWDGGKPVFAISNKESERLDKWLLDKKLISESVLKPAYDIMNKKGKRFGDALIMLGVINEEDLERAISDNMKEIIFDMFSWQHADYTKEEKMEGIKELSSIRDSFPVILFEGISKKTDIDYIKTKLQQRGEVVSFSPNNIFNIEDFKFPHSYNRLMSLINGKRTIYELIGKSGLSHDSAYRFIYTLLLLRLIKLGTGDEHSKNISLTLSNIGIDAGQKTRFTGNLTDVSIIELIQMLELNRKSGTIQISDINEIGWLLFDKGKIIDAYYGDLTRESAVYRILFLTEGEFDIRFKEVVGEPRISLDTQTLLMEGLRMLDEIKRLEPMFGGFEKRFVINPAHRFDTEEEKEELARIFNGKNDVLTSSFLLNPDPKMALDIISTLLKNNVIKEET
jgi:CheY-like chemotaxis protein